MIIDAERPAIWTPENMIKLVIEAVDAVSMPLPRLDLVSILAKLLVLLLS